MGTDSQALTAEDLRAINISKALAADAVEKAGSGHPGTAISLAGVAYLLYQYEMTHDPADTRWLGRDRFILSSGHASLLLYIQLVLAGYGLEVSDLKQLRQWGARTPGHPEFGHTPGVETTTGPLGAGFTNAVGMAMAARFEHGLLDPAAPAGDSVFDHYVYTIMGDGCLQEGVTSEAASLAGAQELGNLIAIYDDNDITIEGSTDLAFTEDPSARFAAYGWQVLDVDWTGGGACYEEDYAALRAALAAARAETTRPSLIRLRTVIAWPAPTKQGQADGLVEAVHGVRSEHAGAGAAGRACVGFDAGELVVADGVVDGHDHGVDEVEAVFDDAVDGGTGFHGAAGDEDGGDVQAHGGQEHAGGDLVAVGDAHEGVGAVCVDHGFDAVGDEVAARQGVEHAVVAHGDAIVDGDRVEFLGDAAGCFNGSGDEVAHVLQVHVAGDELGEGVGDGDDRLAEVAVRHAGGAPQGACSGHVAALGGCCRAQRATHDVPFFCLVMTQQ